MKEYDIKTLIRYGFLDYDDVILPPKDYDEEKIKKIFDDLKELVKEKNINISFIRGNYEENC